QTSAAEGDLVVLTVTPEPGKKLMVNSLKYTANGTTAVIAGNSFAMPAGNVEVTAAFITTSNNPEAWDGSIDTGWYNTADTSFQISTPAQLAGLAAVVNGTADGIAQDYFADKTITLQSSIDLGGVQNQDGTWDPAGAQWTAIGGGEPGEVGAAFNGTFDGGGHIISNLYIERQAAGQDSNAGKNQGLFGIINAKACVKNLGVTGYVAAFRSVGGVVGKNWGRVESCFNAATVVSTANKGVGGIVGANWTQNSTPSVVNCYNTGSVLAKYEVGLAGGIAGDNEYLIANCYNAGPVACLNASPYIGGITGNIKNGSTDGKTSPIVRNCYFNSAYNDKGIGNIDTGAYTITNMEGRTAEEMKTAAFVDLLNADSGNAFMLDTNNSNSGYPILAWQAAATTGDVNGDGMVNILDVVQAVNFAMGETTLTTEQFNTADTNADGS
ncbi:MAG TPA: hypothetical protein DCZ10_14645, partial [Pelotomaculum sp.]|nr:hypothetical protein [Pelotomaculum sp.]